MKPRYRPGKVGARESKELSNPLSMSQMEHIRGEGGHDSPAPKAGRGGKRAKWKLGIEEGFEYEAKEMPWRENESFSQDSIRKIPKRGR